MIASEGWVPGDFGDARPAKRGGLLRAGMVARTSICLRRLAGGRRSGIVGSSRFLANPRVTVAALLDGWGAMAGVLNFRRAARAGIFWRSRIPAKSISRRPERAVAVWTRDGRVTVPHRNRPLSEKGSQRWLSTAGAAKTILRPAHIVTEIDLPFLNEINDTPTKLNRQWFAHP